ncbi:MAG TPA: hypothetical protein VJ927_10415 [Actinomycetota bacterium]|nr:hypothetical protein [Actinomycetota bacterium]
MHDDPQQHDLSAGHVTWVDGDDEQVMVDRAGGAGFDPRPGRHSSGPRRDRLSVRVGIQGGEVARSGDQVPGLAVQSHSPRRATARLEIDA